MKTKARLQQLWKAYFSIFLLTFHPETALCRPSIRNVDSENNNNVHHPDAKGSPSSQVRPIYDLRNVGPTEIYTMRGNRKLLKNNDTLLLFSNKDFINFMSNDVDFIDDASDDDTPTHHDDVVTLDVIENQEGSSEKRHQVVPFTDRNLVRKRRQPEPHKPHRRRRKKHRLVLKARDRNHLSEGEEELKDRRHRFLIKSDSPGYVITSASEVKKDWCRTIPLRQKVSEPKCRSTVIKNNFCYGQCNSFFIPHTGRTDNKVAFQSCAFCKPYKQHWGNVTLNCPGRNPPMIQKTVLFVESCRCITEVFQ